MDLKETWNRKTSRQKYAKHEEYIAFKKDIWVSCLRSVQSISYSEREV